MSPNHKSIQALRAALRSDPNPGAAIIDLAQRALSCANSNAGHNTYLWRNDAWTLAEAHRLAANPDTILNGNEHPLWGVPVSMKDCFDLAGAPTSCGTFFYRDLNGIRQNDSWLAELLRTAGAIITGKTHLHPLAYGITGENPEFGDCLQPEDEGALTGGSSSGAAASVQEGSAFAAIGTDTGGSVRVPAALCGLSGYRATLGRGDWRGGSHLAASFDTFGWLFRHLEDGPLLGSLFGPTETTGLRMPGKVAVVHDRFLHDCEPEVLTSLRRCQAELQESGLDVVTVDVDWWDESREIFAAIQAFEAAQIHWGHFAEFESSIRQRLEWGASLSDAELVQFRSRHVDFRDRMDSLLAMHELLLLPATPVSRLAAGADHSRTRPRLLRYTAPVSLAGMPAVAIPFLKDGRPAGGMQLVAAREDDARLLAVTAAIGAARKSAG